MNFIIAVHGGVFQSNRNNISFEGEKEIKLHIRNALKIGYDKLLNKEQNINVIESVLSYMEDCGIFNAGKGSKLNANLECELEASIMNGNNLNFGTVSLLKNIKNPIKVAKKVLDIYKNLILVGDNAFKFGKINGLELVPNTYYNKIKPKEDKENNEELGTIGCVVLDQNKDLASGISTGGIANKISGRLGDASIIGAGIYADNSSCAISCTGKGEIFIKNCIAYDLNSRLKYKNNSLKEACNEIINKLEKNTGGFICLDKNGNLEMPFNTNGMVRGWLNQTGICHINLFKENEDYTPNEYELQ